MVELADTQVLGTCALKSVGVQVPPAALRSSDCSLLLLISFFKNFINSVGIPYSPIVYGIICISYVCNPVHIYLRIGVLHACAFFVGKNST